MAVPEDKTPNSTNALLAQILKVLQDTQALTVLIGGGMKDILTTEQLALKVANDSKTYLKQIADSISGGDGHVYTVKVQQLAKALAAELSKK